MYDSKVNNYGAKGEKDFMKKMVISLFGILMILFSTVCYAQNEQNTVNSLQTTTRNQSNNK